MDWFQTVATELWAHRGYRLLLIVATAELLAITLMIGALLVQTSRRLADDNRRRNIFRRLRNAIEDAPQDDHESAAIQWIQDNGVTASPALREALLQLGLGEAPLAAKRAWEEFGFAEAERKALRKKGLHRRLKAIRRVYVFADRRDRNAILSALDSEDDMRFRVTAAQALARIGHAEDVLQALQGVVIHRRLMDPPFYAIFRTLPIDELEYLLQSDISGLSYRIQHVLYDVAAQSKITDASLTDVISSWAVHDDLEYRLGATKIATSMGGEPARQTLRKLAQDDAWQVRAQALRGLGKIGNDQDIPLVQNTLADAQFWVRENATYALESLLRTPLESSEMTSVSKSHTATVTADVE